MSCYYENVMFTSATEEYANVIIDDLNSKSYITHRLHRQHISKYNRSCYKDLDWERYN